MKTEGSSVEGRKKGGVAAGVEGRKVIGKRGNGRRAGRRVHPSSRAIQRLFLTCREVFEGHGTVPSQRGVEMLQLLLDRMKPEDVGLSPDLLYFKASSAVKGTPRITYTTIHTCKNFSICLLFLPPKAVIPLHNHPGMTVFSKLLLGTMHIKSYDWVDPVESDAPAPSAQCKLARVVADSDFTAPCNTSILYPTTGGNIHTLIAITPCLVLDVQGPPYSKEDDRDCTYYKDHPYYHTKDNAATRSDPQDDRLGWLEEIDMPKDLKMDVVEYLGPQIINYK